MYWNIGKEARKQELKKNKKQRQLVRAAVLKGKDPHQLIEELEKIDQMGIESNNFLLIPNKIDFTLLQNIMLHNPHHLMKRCWKTNGKN